MRKVRVCVLGVGEDTAGGAPRGGGGGGGGGGGSFRRAAARPSPPPAPPPPAPYDAALVKMLPLVPLGKKPPLVACALVR